MSVLAGKVAAEHRKVSRNRSEDGRGADKGREGSAHWKEHGLPTPGHDRWGSE